MSEALQTALQLLVFGWGGVFVVILVIYFASMILSKLFPVKK
ncbi:OadG-related small transporter subunit [Enterococcus sp. HY326]|nr:OadG-related small transporter subunit [Enterococcus sp. HY326]